MRYGMVGLSLNDNVCAATSRNVLVKVWTQRRFRPACMRIRALSFTLGIFIVNDAKILPADNKGSDQIARIHRLIWVWFWWLPIDCSYRFYQLLIIFFWCVWIDIVWTRSFPFLKQLNGRLYFLQNYVSIKKSSPISPRHSLTILLTLYSAFILNFSSKISSAISIFVSFYIIIIIITTIIIIIIWSASLLINLLCPIQFSFYAFNLWNPQTGTPWPRPGTVTKISILNCKTNMFLTLFVFGLYYEVLNIHKVLNIHYPTKRKFRSDL